MESERLAIRHELAKRISLDPSVYAAQAGQHAHWAALLSQDPSAGPAFECIKISLLALQGKRGADLPPLDFLETLARLLRGASPTQSDEPTFRTLVELVRRTIDVIRPKTGRPRGDAKTEGPSLHRDILNTLGVDWGKLEIGTCKALLVRCSQRSAVGKLTAAGIAREIVLAANVMGYRDTEDGRKRLDKDIAKAISRGRAVRKEKPRKRRKKRARQRKNH
jgi:hypothetical protein